MPLFS
jgi:microcin C transport system permease protein